MDRLDRQLLTIVQEDASRTAQQIADQLPLSVSAVQRRLRRLREAGVIERQVAVLNPKCLGGSTVFIVSLQIEREHPEMLARLRGWLLAQAGIQQAYYVTGDSDFVLIVTAPDTEQFESLMARLVADNPNVRRYTTSVALGTLKRGLALVVPQ